MAASDNLHNHQFEMFMPAHKLMRLGSQDSPVGESMYEDQELADEKLGESLHGSSDGSDSSLYQSIQKEGVVNPVEISGTDGGSALFLEDGNHRVVAAHDINPDMEIPVTYGWYSKKYPRF